MDQVEAVNTFLGYVGVSKEWAINASRATSHWPWSVLPCTRLLTPPPCIHQPTQQQKSQAQPKRRASYYFLLGYRSSKQSWFYRYVGQSCHGQQRLDWKNSRSRSLTECWKQLCWTQHRMHSTIERSSVDLLCFVVVVIVLFLLRLL